MAGKFVPVEMFRKFSSLSGAGTFATVGLEVSEYENAYISVERGNVIGPGSFSITAQESTDQESWSTCNGTGVSIDPGVHTEAQMSIDLEKRYFRLMVALSGSDPQTTLWAIGFLQKRTS